jgi:hypothetical protein
MTARSWCYGIGVWFLLAALAMLFSEAPWGSVLFVILGAFCLYVGFTEPQPYEPYQPSEWEEQLAEAWQRRKDRTGV